jgi:hypothetical protein
MSVLIAVSTTALFDDALARENLLAPRSEFRPLSRSDDKTAYPVRRPQAAPERASGRTSSRAWLPDITSGRKGSRKALPITRGQELGMRFRPDDRDPVQGSARGPGNAGVPAQAQPDVAFRPVPRRNRPTYEELEAERQGGTPPPPMPGGVPMLPGSPVLPPAGLPWIPPW